MGLTERERQIRTERAEVREGQLPIIAKLNRGEKLTVEERADYTARDARLVELDADLEMVLGEQKRAEAERTATPEPEGRGVRGDEPKAEEREWAAFEKWFKHGDSAISGEERSLLTPQAQGRPLYEQRLGPGGDAAALQTSPGSQGGFLVPPGFWHNLQIAMKAYGGVYPLFNQLDTDSGQPMQWPTNDPTTIVAQLLTENTVVTPQDVTFGQGTMNAYTYVAGPFLASIQVMNDSAFSLDSFLRDRIGEAIGRAQAAVAWAGSGSSQPLGLTAALVAKGNGSTGTGGIFVTPAARPIYTLANQGTASTELAKGTVSFQSYLDMITIVDPAYRAAAGDARWVMNDKDLQNARAVTDTFGHPLWVPDVTVGGNEANGRIWSYPVTVDNNAPGVSTSANTLGGPVFGSFTHAMVARNVRQAGVMVLRERYADFLAVAWLGYMRYDIRSNDMRALTQFKTNAT
jgi:HK97 family phage major capsid protein